MLLLLLGYSLCLVFASICFSLAPTVFMLLVFVFSQQTPPTTTRRFGSSREVDNDLIYNFEHTSLLILCLLKCYKSAPAAVQLLAGFQCKPYGWAGRSLICQIRKQCQLVITNTSLQVKSFSGELFSIFFFLSFQAEAINSKEWNNNIVLQ